MMDMENVKTVAVEAGEAIVDLAKTGASWFYGGTAIGIAIAGGMAGVNFGCKVVNGIQNLFADKDDGEDEEVIEEDEA